MSLLDSVDDNVTNMLICWGQDFWCRPRLLYDRIRQHEIKYESGLARFTGFLDPVDIIAPSKWACDAKQKISSQVCVQLCDILVATVFG
ncbi:MAG: hypothetical protein U0996_04955 [Planctomycetaceae bacterium]